MADAFQISIDTQIGNFDRLNNPLIACYWADLTNSTVFFNCLDLLQLSTLQCAF